MQFIKSTDKEWEDKKGYSKKIFLTEKDLNKKGMHVQEIRIKAGETAANHYHKKQTEIFYFLNDNGHFEVDKKIIRPKKGEIIVIKPLDRHKVVNDTKKDFLYMAFKFDYEPEDIIWEKE